MRVNGNQGNVCPFDHKKPSGGAQNTAENAEQFRNLFQSQQMQTSVSFNFSAKVSFSGQSSFSSAASAPQPTFGQVNPPAQDVVSFGLSMSQQLRNSTAMLQTVLNLTQLVQTLTQSLFTMMQPSRDVPAHEVPSSFAAACPCGGNQQKPAGYGQGVGTGVDYGTGYGAGNNPGNVWNGTAHIPTPEQGDAEGGPIRIGSGYIGDLGSAAGGAEGTGAMPHDHPSASDVASYKPGSGCPVMDAFYNPNEDPDSAEAPLRRLFEADYGDGQGSMAGADRPGAREISNAVSAASGDTPSQIGATDLFWGWGQFLDHDLSLSEGGADDPHPITMPNGDARFDPDGTGDVTLAFNRTPGHLDENGIRQQSNAITPLLDGSNVYGSTPMQEASLREGEGGRMLLDARGNLPRSDEGFFIAGDVRVNENPLLASMHTVFAREHNRLADEFAEQYPDWTDDQIFEAARDINVAQMQSITANEFLPMLLGPDALGDYDGPQDVDPQISNAFATAAYRFGHTMVSDNLKFIDENGQESEMSLMDAFFNTNPIDQGGIDDVLRGAASQVAQEMDTEIVDSLRNNVMTGPEATPLDLASLNIQRGRDHGLPSLNDMKRALGQTPLTGFDDPRLRDGVGERLAEVYTSIEDVDAWVGMLSEKPVGCGMSGETQAAVLAEQFKRTRDGDPDWYEAKFSPGQVEELNNTTLADIIERNVYQADIQDYAMLSQRHQPNVA